VTRIVSIGMAGAAALLAFTAAAHPRRIGDRDLLRYAATKFDKRAMLGRRLVLGEHRGTLVVATFTCGDVCPAYTKRIIHYDVPPEQCDAVGGMVVDELVPRGPAVRPKPYCEPRVLAERAGRPRP
jgi:hypothetical protein